jgi:hypothetical protein
VTGTARRVSTGWRRAGVRSSDGGCVAPTMNDELRRTPAMNGKREKARNERELG